MSHGGRENGRVHGKLHAKRKSGGNGDEFAQAIAKIAVAQICESTGFQAFQQSALDTLSDVTVRYISHIGKTAQFCANLSGRAEENALDVIQGLEELTSSQGFAGASDIDHCLGTSGVVREIIQYVGESEDIPFAYSMPPFPVIRESQPGPSFSQKGEEPPDEHIPAWLPVFPDPHTYLQLSAGNVEDVRSNKDKIEPASQHRKTDTSMFNLQQRVIGKVSEGLSIAPGGSVGPKQSLANNPFLTAPLQFGEKELSQFVHPANLSNESVRNPVQQNSVVSNRISVLDTFAPAIEAMKSNLCNSEEGQKKSPLNQRPFVRFKVRGGKKSLGTALTFSPQNKGVEKIDLWLGKDNDKDDKKRRAAEILKQSIENPGEFAQL